MGQSLSTHGKMMELIILETNSKHIKDKKAVVSVDLQR